MERLESAHSAVLEQLELEAPSGRPEVFFVPGRSEMRRLLGTGPGGMADIASNSLYLTHAPGAEPPLLHELGHLYSWRGRGAPATYWLSEGVAVWAARDCAGHPLHV